MTKSSPEFPRRERGVESENLKTKEQRLQAELGVLSELKDEMDLKFARHYLAWAQLETEKGDERMAKIFLGKVKSSMRGAREQLSLHQQLNQPISDDVRATMEKLDPVIAEATRLAQSLGAEFGALPEY